MNRPGGEPALRLDGIVKTFRQGERALHVLDGVSAEVNPGELVVGLDAYARVVVLQPNNRPGVREVVEGLTTPG